MAKKKINDWWGLVAAILLSQGAGVIGASVTFEAVRGWYVDLAKPFFTPPSWVFGPVWTLLYTMMGISVWLVWRKGWGKARVREAVVWFLGQLGLNIGWSYLFFGWKNPGWAYGEILVLLVVLGITIKKFLKIEKWAGWLLVPYFAWGVFASFLNLGVWWLNK